ncbi:hypothetical protein F5I97DRAFT_1830230 [Phlebopus sp. FC_14]|nr:hypothetical protein F5I97DRAFT_1830230 [Phlebopus sp. FC_14]
MASINIYHYSKAKLALHDGDSVEMILAKVEKTFQREQKAEEHAWIEAEKKRKEIAEVREKILAVTRAQVEKERKWKVEEEKKTREAAKEVEKRWKEKEKMKKIADKRKGKQKCDKMKGWCKCEAVKNVKHRSAIPLLSSINHKLSLLSLSLDPNYIPLKMDSKDQKLTETEEINWGEEEKELCREERGELTPEREDDKVV